MIIEEIREYCLAKPGVTEGFPFNDTALPFINLKCDSAAGGPSS